jgi:hypothetical protein
LGTALGVAVDTLGLHAGGARTDGALLVGVAVGVVGAALLSRNRTLV